jgi:Ca2+-binding EF-hand superfamily protein
LCSPKIYLENIRDKIKQRGARGIIGLARMFKIIDDNNNKSLDRQEFKKAILDFKLEVPDEHITLVFNAFDLNRDGTIDYDEFLRIIRGDLTPNRLALV